MYLWVKERPTKIGKYWCFQNNHSRIVSIWKNKYNKLFTTENNTPSLEDVYYDDALWWSEKIEPPENPYIKPKVNNISFGRQNVTDTWR